MISSLLEALYFGYWRPRSCFKGRELGKSSSCLTLTLAGFRIWDLVRLFVMISLLLEAL